MPRHHGHHRSPSSSRSRSRSHGRSYHRRYSYSSDSTFSDASRGRSYSRGDSRSPSRHHDRRSSRSSSSSRSRSRSADDRKSSPKKSKKAADKTKPRKEKKPNKNGNFVLIRYVFKNQATEKAMTVDKKKFFTNRKQALRAFCESTASYQSGMTNHEMEYLAETAGAKLVCVRPELTPEEYKKAKAAGQVEKRGRPKASKAAAGKSKSPSKERVKKEKKPKADDKLVKSAAAAILSGRA